MQLIYNDVDITKDIKIISGIVKDNCGGIADTASLILSDSEKLWRKWNPQKNDKIRLISGSFSSGLMFIDDIRLLQGKYSIKGISTPLNAKTTKSRAWENIRFKKLAQDLAGELGLAIEFYNVTDYTYDRLDQINKSNLEFLNERCILEYYNLKITDGKIVVYDGKALESANAVQTFNESDFVGSYDFANISSGLYSAAEIKYFTRENTLLEYKYTNSNLPPGPTLKIDKLRAGSIGEAERYTKNLLKFHNKNEVTGTFATRLNTNIAAANTISIKDLGAFSGKYFIESLNQDLTNDKSYFKVRKALEGY